LNGSSGLKNFASAIIRLIRILDLKMADSRHFYAPAKLATIGNMETRGIWQVNKAARSSGVSPFLKAHSPTR
jgi:hypothetical protein